MLLQVHLWSGIAVGLYILMISVTGSVLVYRNELYRAATPELIISKGPGARLTDNQLKEAATRLYLGYRVVNLGRALDFDHAVDVWLRRGDEIKKRLFDPRSGSDLGDSVPTGIRLVSKLLDLHDNLLLGPTGRRGNGIGALAVLSLAVTGLVIWWPGIRTWCRSLTLHRGVGWKRMIWDLHSMIGFWSIGFIPVFALSGVYLGLPQPFQDLADRLEPLTAANAGTRIGDRVIYWLAYLHFGRINGIGIPCSGPGLCDQTTKAIWSVFGMAPAVMFVTGAIMWWNRVLRPRWASARRPARCQPISARISHGQRRSPVQAMYNVDDFSNIDRMKHYRFIVLAAGIGIAAALLLYAAKTDGMNVMTGPKAFTNTASLSPGLARKITAQDLPQPQPPMMLPRLRMYVTAGFSRPGKRPDNAIPKAPAGFKIDIYVATGLDTPRQMRRAPNGDIFMADTGAGTVRIFRGITAEGKPQVSSVYASLPAAFGIDFYPPGPNPHWVYVANTSTLVRYAYKNGDLKAAGAPEKLITDIPADGGHSTRDIVFSKDGKSLFLAVGSQSNNKDGEAEFHRANILEYTPEGKFVGIYASGIRNPVGLAINPETSELWTSVNERDNLGDNLVPDYVTHVARGGFYGWPWFYIGGNQDPAHAGKHPELKDKVIVPDVLIQAHSASLGMAFYDGKMFPAEYSGDAFAAEHGSWNHTQGSGREVIRIPIEKGRATGVYQDFLTGFTTDGTAWGRPVGVAIAADGSLLVTDDGARMIWRVSYTGK